MSYLAAMVSFQKGEPFIRSLTSGLPIAQYLETHFTILYGCKPFKMETFMEQFTSREHPVYTCRPKPVGYKSFHNKANGYKALVIEYEWEAGRAVNVEAASNPDIYPAGISKGFNGDKWCAHVTIAYIDEAYNVEEFIKTLPPPEEIGQVKVDSMRIFMKTKPL